MTTYRFRVKFESDPTALWRDVIVGADRTLAEVQSVVNRAVGLNQDDLWFFGTDQDYWDSKVLYKSPMEVEQSPERRIWPVEEYDAGERTVGQMIRRLELAKGDRVCYLFDYGDEWRFYAISRPSTRGYPASGSPRS